MNNHVIIVSGPLNRYSCMCKTIESGGFEQIVYRNTAAIPYEHTGSLMGWDKFHIEINIYAMRIYNVDKEYTIYNETYYKSLILDTVDNLLTCVFSEIKDKFKESIHYQNLLEDIKAYLTDDVAIKLTLNHINLFISENRDL